MQWKGIATWPRRVSIIEFSLNHALAIQKSTKNLRKKSRVFKLYHVLFYTTHFTVGRCFTLAEGDRSCLKCFVTKCHSVFQAPHGNSDGAAHLLRDKKLELYVKLYKL